MEERKQGGIRGPEEGVVDDRVRSGRERERVLGLPNEFPTQETIFFFLFLIYC